MAAEGQEGLALAARAAAACRALASAPMTQPGYATVGAALLRRIERLLGPVQHLRQLDAANDDTLKKLEVGLAQLGGRALPVAPEPLTVVQPIPAHLVARPQFAFSTQPDNSNNPWRPLLQHKPHAVRPLQLEEERDPDGRLLGYSHPYQFEIDTYKPPELFINSDKLPPIAMKELNDTTFTYVDNVSGLNALVEHLKSVKEIAVDLEHHSYRTFQGITCLIQITTEEGGDFILDALSLRDHLSSLNESFTNPEILKVFHGGDMDIKWLQRDFGVYVVGMFDTHIASIELGLPIKSLQALLQHYCNVTSDKTLRLSDWRARPLLPELLNYARIDTHYLLYIWRRMKDDLLKKSNQLMNVFNNSKKVCSIKYMKQRFDEDGHTFLLFKSRKSYNSRQIEALRLLFKWRDELARREDESVGYVLPNHMLLKISQMLPKEASGILACCVPTPPLLIQQLEVIYRLVLQASAVPLIEAPSIPTLPEQENLTYCPMIYERQILDEEEDRSIPPFIERIAKYSETVSKGSILTSKNEEHGSINLESITRSFVPPFERFLSIKEYLKTNSVPEPVVTIATNLAALKEASLIESTELNLEKPPIVEDDRVILFNFNNKVAKRARLNLLEEEAKDNPTNNVPPVQNINSKNQEPKKKSAEESKKKNGEESRKRSADEANFKSFDYKNYNYNVYDRRNPNKRKRGGNKPYRGK